MPRTNTPDRTNPDGSKTITTKRACNGCGELIGDITEEEMARTMKGLPLPDVRRECPTCAPTAPEPKCLPVAVLAGDQFCLELECDHEHSAEGGPDGLEESYCDEVREETVCGTHSTFQATGWGEELVHAEPWPCNHNTQAVGS
ncbi:hypothetical protein TU94_28160 [Streptomyces cyaneogriseus subsp. noncyanogenus]|uniref:Uncharacterized protein n=1 Tax=Streptomyces cyaneogriseus subsp. noncyanogenus TaxID=477245 RepID=A0A0C5GJR5_9ACTN|nr:hypothetical protein [Streptomyces cyaneogriseus]AJP04746.1 hypothetical protein TU94_28160 [Streptomyces cyaneogriseus subsp. noncyanogenus]